MTTFHNLTTSVYIFINLTNILFQVGPEGNTSKKYSLWKIVTAHWSQRQHLNFLCNFN